MFRSTSKVPARIWAPGTSDTESFGQILPQNGVELSGERRNLELDVPVDEACRDDALIKSFYQRLQLYFLYLDIGVPIRGVPGSPNFPFPTNPLIKSTVAVEETRKPRQETTDIYLTKHTAS